MRGYFGIGAEGISKSMNVGAIFRTAHAFGASFVYTVNAAYGRKQGGWADTSNSLEHLPFYDFPTINDMQLPKDCRLVGVELTDDAVELPSFRHPSKCAYILGPERGSLSPEMVEKCEFVVKIPTKFCINVSVAAALIMYDRTISMGRFAERPVRAGGPVQELAEHQHGLQLLKTAEKFLQTPPMGEGFDPDGYND
ncbi:MAG: RNA methyltransferase [Rhodospirillaceae bacterium]|nr:MAG: RNA methyltransferase [Rhodospirillaceae bacterium]